MKKRIRCFIPNKTILFMLLCSCMTVYVFPLHSNAQSQAEKGLPFITNYEAKTFKALPQAWCIQEDDQGIMYFGVQNYILEYDGVKWRKITFDNNPVSNVVRSMSKSKDGVIYYGAYGDMGYLTRDSLGQTDSKSLLDAIPASNRNFLDVWSTYSTDNGVYFQSRAYIFRIAESPSSEANVATVWKSQTNFMYAFYIDDTYYVHQQGLGLYQMLNDSLVLIPGSEFLGQERMQVMLPYTTVGNEKKYLLGMFYSGLYLFDGKTFQPFATKSDPIIKSGSILYKGLQLKNGSYVLSTTGKGLVIINAQGDLLQRINREVGLQDESIYGVYEDQKGILWLALDNGISRVEIASPFTQFTLQSGINTGVLSIQRFDGTMYIGTTNGLLRYDHSRQFFNPVPGIPQNQIFSLLAVENTLIVPGDGLFAIQDKNTVIIRPSVSGDLSLSIIYISRKNPDLLFVGGQFGVAVFTRENENTAAHRSTNWRFAGNVPHISEQIWTFSENKDGHIWAGSANGVVYQLKLVMDEQGNLDLKNTGVEEFGAAQGLQNGVGSVVSIKGTNYFVADSSLYTFDENQKRFIPDTTFGKFINGGAATEFAMVEDHQGRVWIRAGKETRLATPKPEGGYSLNDTQFNSLAELTVQSIYPEKNGVVWIGTTDGLIRYDEDLENHDAQSFVTVIRHVSAGKHSLSTIINQSVKPVSVSYKYNTLRFEYAAPFFEQEEKTTYQTWLEGFEEDWTDFGNNYYKEYTNLAAGDYHFHVRAKNIYQKLSEEAIYTFSIHPPWYRTWWSYLLYVLAAIGIIYALIRWRTHQLHEKHRELEKTVEERTAQLSHRVEELAVINTVQEGLVAQMTMVDIYELVGEKIREIFNAQVIDIATYDSSANLLEDHYSYEKGDRTLSGTWTPNGFRKYVIDAGQVLLINEDLDRKSIEFNSKVVRGEQPKSAVFVPLIAGNVVKGMISLQNLDKEHAFSDSSVNLLTTLANSMSVALESARRFDETTRLLRETEQRTAELSVINSVQEGLARELDIQGIYELVGEKMRQIFNAQVIDIVTYDSRTNLLEDRYVFEKGDNTLFGTWEPYGFRKHVIETGQVLLINEDIEGKSAEYHDDKVLTGEPPKSCVFVPLISGNEVKGMISLQNLDKEHAFSDSSVNLLTTLANSMSVALESARRFDETIRLLKETEQRTAELAVINSVQEGLVKEMDLQGIYNLVGDRIQKLFNVQVVIIASFDLDRQTEHFNYFFENDEKVNAESRPINKLRQILIEKKHTIYISTTEQGIKEYGLSPIGGTQVTKSLLFVPLLTGSIIRGYVSLQNIDTESAFSVSDIRLLETLANSMSVALENARLFDETKRLLKETERRTAELAVINSVQEGLAKELDLEGIYNLIGDRIQKLFNAQVVLIASFDLDAQIEYFNYLFENNEKVKAEPRPFNKLRELLIDKKHSIYISTERQAEEEYGLTPIAGTQMPKSLLFVPLLKGSIIRGYVSLQNIDTEDAFSVSDIRLLETLANSMSVALENARLFDETNRLLKETEQRTGELAVINSVQEGLAKELDMQGIYKLIGDRLCSLFPDTTTLIIRTFDHENGLEHFHYAIENGDYLEINPQPLIWESQQLILTKKPLAIQENYEDVTGSAVTEGLPVKSAVFVPMTAGDVVKGSISLQNVDRENAFSESDLRLLNTLTSSMSVALENARLFDETNRLLKETEQRTAELSIINSVQEGLARELDIQGIYDLVGEKMRKIFNAQVFDIVTHDKTSHLIEDRYTYEKGDRTLVGPRPLKGFRKHVIDTAKPLVINKNVDLLRPKYDQTITSGKGAKSLVMVPMIAGDEVTGVISLQNLDQEYAFSDSDVSLLTTMANSMSVALESARLFDETNRLLKETEQRTAELAVINNVQEGLASELDIRGIYHLVGDRICELFDTQSVLIRSFDHSTGLEHWQYAVEKGEHIETEPRPFIWANKLLIQTKQPLLINKDYLETAKNYGGTGVTRGQPPKSAMFVPMIAGDVVKGSVSLQNIDREAAFTDTDLRLLTTLTNSMSVALENARLFDETTYLLGEAKQRATELTTVNSISKALASQLNADDLIKLVGDELKNLFNANIVYLALLNQKTKIIHFPYSYGDEMTPMKLGEGLTSKIILTGEPLLINKDVEEFRTQIGIQRVGVPSASYLGVPIPVGDEIIGVLSIQSTEQENRFNENDLRLLSTIASSVGVALRNATLFEDVKLAKMEAETAGRLAEKANEAKSAFLSTVSHELRTPLTSVLGFAKIIKKSLEGKIFPVADTSDVKIEKAIKQVSGNLDIVISEGERLTHLINDVLDLAKIEAGKMEWNQENVSMSVIAERAMAATTALFSQKPLKLIRQIDDNLPEISGDKDKLIQVIINLISNAVKFTDKGSVTCRVFQEKHEIIVSVSDTGIGIAPEDFGAVFEQFKQVGGDTLTDKPKGTGLGLPICKEIVEHHGGRIWLESVPGQGSTFSFALPLSHATLPRPMHLDVLVRQLKEQVAHSQLNVKGLSATILIVDDDDSIRSLLQQELGDAGYLIEEARNGKEALARVRANRPDLIVLDIMMPEMNGFDVAAVLKNDPQTMDIPIIVLSIVQDKARGYRIGVDRYLTKPIDTGLLFTEIGSLLEQGKSKKKVMIVDEDSGTVNTLTEVLKTKGYSVTESNELELVEKAVAQQPDIIIINSLLSNKQDIVQTLRFEKGLENVLFLVYQ